MSMSMSTPTTRARLPSLLPSAVTGLGSSCEQRHRRVAVAVAVVALAGVAHVLALCGVPQRAPASPKDLSSSPHTPSQRRAAHYGSVYSTLQLLMPPTPHPGRALQPTTCRACTNGPLDDPLSQLHKCLLGVCSPEPLRIAQAAAHLQRLEHRPNHMVRRPHCMFWDLLRTLS
jgi:hypothetical protein